MLAHLLTMEDLRENPLTWPPFAPRVYKTCRPLNQVCQATCAPAAS